MGVSIHRILHVIGGRLLKARLQRLAAVALASAAALNTPGVPVDMVDGAKVSIDVLALQRAVASLTDGNFAPGIPTGVLDLQRLLAESAGSESSESTICVDLGLWATLPLAERHLMPSEGKLVYFAGPVAPERAGGYRLAVMPPVPRPRIGRERYLFRLTANAPPRESVFAT